MSLLYTDKLRSTAQNAQVLQDSKALYTAFPKSGSFSAHRKAGSRQGNLMCRIGFSQFYDLGEALRHLKLTLDINP